jgi:hypothetical protein
VGAAAARKSDLTGVIVQMGRAAGQQHSHALRVLHQRNEHGGGNELHRGLVELGIEIVVAARARAIR